MKALLFSLFLISITSAGSVPDHQVHMPVPAPEPIAISPLPVQEKVHHQQRVAAPKQVKKQAIRKIKHKKRWKLPKLQLPKIQLPTLKGTKAKRAQQDELLGTVLLVLGITGAIIGITIIIVLLAGGTVQLAFAILGTIACALLAISEA